MRRGYRNTPGVGCGARPHADHGAVHLPTMSRTQWMTRTLGIALVLLGGCGLTLNNGEDAADDVTPTDDAGVDATAADSVVSTAQAQADCVAFFTNTYCPAVVSCSPGTSDQATCPTQVQNEVDCGRVTGETAGLADCAAELGATTCDNLLQSLPVSCVGVFF